tara:strand:+ start:1070 stop:1264 length:195 start_codon:yes stop_codon:yes gene_type:complete
MDIVKIVDELRQEQGLKWRHLADKANVSEPTLFNWRRGLSAPTLSRVEMVLDALGYEIEVVLKR